MSFDTFIQLTWIALSSIAVVLALWATSYAKKEARDTREERAFQRSRHVTNGRLVIAEQQHSQAVKLLWAHRGVYAHQAFFLAAGLYALLAPSLPKPEHLPVLQSIVIPLALLAAQFVIVVMQVLLFLLTREQRQARKEWVSKDTEAEHLQKSVDAGFQVAEDTNERVRDVQERLDE